MNALTVVFILLAMLASAFLAWFKYYYRVKSRGRTSLLLALLRFTSLMGLLLLLINPKLVKNEYRIEKTDLIVLVDNSSSVASSADTIRNILGLIDGNTALEERFDLSIYRFGSTLQYSDLEEVVGDAQNGSGEPDTLGIQSNTDIPNDSAFTGKNTNITAALSGIADIHETSNAAVLLLSDGNQTLGQDYEFYGRSQKIPTYTMAVGDTTRYDDIAIARVNANPYAFLKNKYPIEVYLNYNGKSPVNKQLKISLDGKTVFRKNIKLDKDSNTAVLNTLLDASTIGPKRIVISVDSLVGERNTANNVRQLAVEVVDEKTDVVIVSNILHPDIGTLKKAIETNEQRSATIKKPTANISDFKDADLLILYQPDASFRPIYDIVKKRRLNTFTIAGTQTDWNFLNQVQNNFSKQNTNQSEEIFPIPNTGFGRFDISDFTLTDFPPLLDNLGEISLNETSETLLGQRIKGADINQPMLAVMGNDQGRDAVLFGENLWKWRVRSYQNDKSFDNFDTFIGQLMSYLSTDTSRERLRLDYEPVFEGSSNAAISAVYFDETYAFDANATLDISLTNLDTKEKTEMPMLLKGINYEADLNSLVPGRYRFTVSVRNENISKSGTFSILDFDIEKQMISTDYLKLERLAKKTGASSYFPIQIDSLIADLVKDERFVPVQKGQQNVVPLIDFWMLLAVIAIALAAEWFIRKYHGLA